jgi:hypothetical protein
MYPTMSLTAAPTQVVPTPVAGAAASGEGDGAKKQFQFHLIKAFHSSAVVTSQESMAPTSALASDMASALAFFQQTPAPPAPSPAAVAADPQFASLASAAEAFAEVDGEAGATSTPAETVERDATEPSQEREGRNEKIDAVLAKLARDRAK